MEEFSFFVFSCGFFIYCINLVLRSDREDHSREVHWMTLFGHRFTKQKDSDQSPVKK